MNGNQKGGTDFVFFLLIVLALYVAAVKYLHAPLPWFQQNSYINANAPDSKPSYVHPTSHPASAPPGSGWYIHWSVVWHDMIALIPLLIVMLGLWAVIRYGYRTNRARIIEVVEIVLGPDDETTPYEMTSALNTIHGLLFSRYAASAIGNRLFTFEIVRSKDKRVHFLIGSTDDKIKAIQDTLQAKYTNIRFEPWRGGIEDVDWAYCQQIHLQEHWKHSTLTQMDYQNSIIETIVQTMDSTDGPVHLQMLLTPMHGRRTKKRLKKKANQMDNPNEFGGGVVQTQMVRDAIQNTNSLPFRVEIRLAALNYDAIQRVFASLQEAGGENRFAAASVSPNPFAFLFRPLWLRWYRRRIPSWSPAPPFFKSNIMFTFPLASIIHLPRVRLRINTLNRVWVRRGPAPMEVNRHPDFALVQDVDGNGSRIGLFEGDRKFNVVMFGSQGSGKSTDFLNIASVDANFRDNQGRQKALIIIDIGKDTGKRALGMIPPDREVIWFDPSDPNCPWTINPLHLNAPADTLATNIIESMRQVFGEESIQAKSSEFLGNAIIGVKEVEGDKAELNQVYNVLTNIDYAQTIGEGVKNPHSRKYWQITFPMMLKENPRFLIEGMSAPRNKLDGLLRNSFIRAIFNNTPGRKFLDMRDVIQGRKVLICNLDKSADKLGKEGARLVGVILITLIWHALEGQNVVPEADRIPCSLMIDEAQNFLTKQFLDILAEGRAYGAQTTVAMRFLNEIPDLSVQDGLKTLAQNVFIHQFELVNESEDMMKKVMRVYANMVSPKEESQDRINFGVDDFIKLPKHHTICRWMVNGQVAQAFHAKTIRWEERYHEEWRKYHLAQNGLKGTEAWETQDDPAGPEEVEVPLARPFEDDPLDEEPIGFEVDEQPVMDFTMGDDGIWFPEDPPAETTGPEAPPGTDDLEVDLSWGTEPPPSAPLPAPSQPSNEQVAPDVPTDEPPVKLNYREILEGPKKALPRERQESEAAKVEEERKRSIVPPANDADRDLLDAIARFAEARGIDLDAAGKAVLDAQGILPKDKAIEILEWGTKKDLKQDPLKSVVNTIARAERLEQAAKILGGIPRRSLEAFIKNERMTTAQADQAATIVLTRAEMAKSGLRGWKEALAEIKTRSENRDAG